MPTFTSLVEDMLIHAKKLDAYLDTDNRGVPSFGTDVLENLPYEIEQVRNEFIDKAQMTKQLALGPRGLYTELLFNFADEVALRAIYTYDLAKHVPLAGHTTYAAISQASGLRLDLVVRFLRKAMSNHIFEEPVPGAVGHTASSRLLVTDPAARDGVGLMTCEFSPAGMRTIDALQRWPDSDEHAESAWALGNEEVIGPYQDLAKHPERARRFGMGMKYFAKGQGWDLKHLVEGYPWKDLDSSGKEALFVDVGGGHGTVSRAIAESTTNIEFVVQDLEGTVKAGEQILPQELRGRVKFQAHDFFQEQPVRGADVYFLRWILHNWSDGYCLEILRALVPAFKKGTKLIVYEFVLEDGPETRLTQKQPRNMDIMMLAQFNSCERTAEDWRALFEKAHPKLRLCNIIQPPGSVMCIIEAVLDD